MKRVYLDNGSTSFPKAPGVSDAVKNFMDNVGTNVNRGGYEEAYAAEEKSCASCSTLTSCAM